MNLLQKICNLFITENKLYTDILAIPLTFVEALITALIFTSILNIKHSKNQILIYSILVILQILSVLSTLLK